jgi:hypothetical protein
VPAAATETEIVSSASVAIVNIEPADRDRSFPLLRTASLSFDCLRS